MRLNEPGSNDEPTQGLQHRLVGLGGLVRALGNLGLWRRQTAAGGGGSSLLQADDGQRIVYRQLGAWAARASPLTPNQVCGRTAPAATPVVLLHGLGCTHRHWVPVARQLARRAPVLAWDARCHGASLAQAGARVTLERLADDLQLLLDRHALDSAVLVGHSMGALVALQYLQRHGSRRVRALALVDQSPRIVSDTDWRCGIFGGCSRETLLALIGSARQDLPGTVLRELESALRAAWPHHPALQRWLDRMLQAALQRWLGAFDASALLDLAHSLVDADFRPLLGRLDIPLWVALGARSPHYAGVPLADHYRRAVPHASITVYPRAGHSPHVSEPLRFARDLQAFIDDHA